MDNDKTNATRQCPFLNKAGVFADITKRKNDECKMNIDRTTAMEQRLEKATAAIDALEAAMEQYLSVQEDIEVLDDYLGGDEWHADRADDEAGRLPPRACDAACWAS